MKLKHDGPERQLDCGDSLILTCEFSTTQLFVIGV